MNFEFNWTDLLDHQDTILAEHPNKLAAGIKETQAAVSTMETKLSGIEAGATKTTVDRIFSLTSTNPVENKTITSKINEMQVTIEDLGQNALQILTFNWDGNIPQIYITEIEPMIEINLSGYFKLNGEPCGKMNTTAVLLNYRDNVDNYNNGITYITASINLRTFEIDCSSVGSETYVPPHIENGVWYITVAICYVEMSNDHSSITVGTVDVYSASTTTVGVVMVTGVKGDNETSFRTGNVNITKNNIGLGNVDNTSDANKPISTAMQNALNKKIGYDFGGNYNGFASLAELTKSVADRSRCATIVVAASDSTHKNGADYICTGTNDQDVINNAIATALPSTGGKIVLLEGTYNISGPINVSKTNVTIEGMGMGATTIKSTASSWRIIDVAQTTCRLKDFTLLNAISSKNNAGIAIININCTLDNVEIFGFGYGVNCSDSSAATHAKFVLCTVHDCLIGIRLNCSKSTVSKCVIYQNSDNGIRVENDSNLLDNNTIDGCGTGIHVQGNKNYISDNYVWDSTTTGIHIYNGFFNQARGGIVYHEADYTASQYSVLLGSGSNWCTVQGVLTYKYKATVDNGTNNTIS